ncbi:hypothetical protein FI667_g17705, partial [Globisporangium splendens]
MSLDGASPCTVADRRHGHNAVPSSVSVLEIRSNGRGTDRLRALLDTGRTTGARTPPALNARRADHFHRQGLISFTWSIRMHRLLEAENHVWVSRHAPCACVCGAHGNPRFLCLRRRADRKSLASFMPAVAARRALGSQRWPFAATSWSTAFYRSSPPT